MSTTTLNSCAKKSGNLLNVARTLCVVYNISSGTTAPKANGNTGKTSRVTPERLNQNHQLVHSVYLWCNLAVV